MPKDDYPPAFLFYVDDFASDGIVEAMSTQEVGAYILLLCKAWREDPPGSIPNDDRVLSRWARLTPGEWSECRTGVLAAFSFGTDDRWHQKRMRKEFAKLKESARNRSKLAKRAADARWHDERCVTHASGNADAMPKHAISSSSSSSSSFPKEIQIPAAIDDEKFLTVWKEWLAFRKKRKWSCEAECLTRQLNQLEKIGIDGAIECVEESLKNGWQGIFPERFKRGHGTRKIRPGSEPVSVRERGL